MKSARAASLFLLSAVLWPSGCQTLEPAHFEVEPSSLDYVEFVYHPQATNGSASRVCRLLLSGSGMVECRVGTSARVSDEFWGEPDGSQWDDMVVDRVVLSGEDTQRVFQRIVDSGFLSAKETPSVQPVPGMARLIAVGRIDGRKRVLIADVSSPVVAVYRDLLAVF